MATGNGHLLAATLILLLLLTWGQVRGQGDGPKEDLLVGGRQYLYLEDFSQLVMVQLDNGMKLVRCEIIKDRSIIRFIIRVGSFRSRKSVSRPVFDLLVTSCNSMQQSPPNSYFRWKRFDILQAMFAILNQTKWCGPGNRSKHFDDLGPAAGADACCRDHDHCNVSISAGARKYGLVNQGAVTLSHCNCDSAFFDCLKADETKLADDVGEIFFNVFNLNCIKEVHPTICVDKGPSSKCKESGPDITTTVMAWAKNTLEY